MGPAGVRQPGCRGFSALGPWLCVLVFQRVCPFAPQFLILNNLNSSIQITDVILCKNYAACVKAYKSDSGISSESDRFAKVYVISVEKTAYYCERGYMRSLICKCFSQREFPVCPWLYGKNGQFL